MEENKLMDFVGLNEMTKQIVVLAENVELMSMNALLTNKDSHGRSGFSAVSEELRAFSLDVKQGAKQLSLQFSLIISQIACESKFNRRARIFHDTQIKSPLAEEYVIAAQKEIHNFLASSYSDFIDSLNRALRLLQKIEHHCIVGNGLSMTGKIEATYLNKLGEMLYDISGTIGNMILEVFTIIKEMKERLGRYLL